MKAAKILWGKNYKAMITKYKVPLRTQTKLKINQTENQYDNDHNTHISIIIMAVITILITEKTDFKLTKQKR